MRVQNVLGTDILDVGKFILSGNIPHFNEFDGVTVSAGNVYQDGGEVADPFAVTQLLFNFLLHFIRHAGIARVENAASVGAIVVVTATENDRFTVE